MATLVYVEAVDEAKKQERLEQLAAVDGARQAERERRRQHHSEKADPQENVKLFLLEWKEGKERFDSALAELANSEPASDERSRSRVKAEVESISRALFHLERQVANASYFLPAFEIRNLAALATALRAQLDATRTKLLPRQKFRFSHPEVIIAVDDPLMQGLTTRARIASGGQCSVADAGAVGTSAYLDPATTISGMTGQRIVKDASELQGKDWMLRDLQDCTVLLHGPLQALYLHRLKNCHVQGGPVSGATFGEDLDECTLMVASHQVRLHNTTNSDVYVAAGSDPIIEHSSAVAFAPLPPLPYAGYDAALAAARIPAGSASWRRVQDFQFPGYEESPNWSAKADADCIVPLC